MHFVESQYIIEYFLYSDIISSFGGLFASLNLLTGWVSVFFVIWFLYRIVSIYKRKILQEQYINKHLKFLKRRLAYFQKIRDNGKDLSDKCILNITSQIDSIKNLLRKNYQDEI